MARIINFYVPASCRRITRKQASITGPAKVIPFPSPARQGHSGSVSLGRSEPTGVRRILRNNGILGLIAGV